MGQLFLEGGWQFMTLLTLELVALGLAAWKAPAWVKETGLIALVTGFLATMMGVFQMAGSIRAMGDPAIGIVWGGLKVTFIPLFYGMLIYLVSLVVRIAQKPRFL